MPKVVVEVSEATNIVERIILLPVTETLHIDGYYYVTGVDDYIVALGWICDRTTTPATFAPNPNPPVAASSMAAALDKLAQADVLQAEARAMIEALVI